MASVRFKSLEASAFVQSQALVQATSTVTITNIEDVPNLVEGDTWTLQATLGQQNLPNITFLFTATGDTVTGQISIDISSGSAAQIVANLVSAFGSQPIPGFPNNPPISTLYTVVGYAGGSNFVLQAGSMLVGTIGNSALVGTVGDGSHAFIPGGASPPGAAVGWNIYWASGANTGSTSTIADFNSGTWVLSAPTSSPISPGDTFWYYPNPAPTVTSSADSTHFIAPVSLGSGDNNWVIYWLPGSANAGTTSTVESYDGTSAWVLTAPVTNPILPGDTFAYSYASPSVAGQAGSKLNPSGTATEGGSFMTGGIDSTFVRTGYFDQPTYGLALTALEFEPSEAITGGDFGLLPDDLTVNGVSCSDAYWQSQGWVTHYGPAPAPANRFDFGTPAGTSYAELVPYLGHLKGWIISNFAMDTSDVNPNNADVNFHFVAFQDMQAYETYGIVTHILFAVLYLGNQDAVIDGLTLVSSAALTVGSTAYGPNGGANVTVTPPANLVWDVPGFITFLNASDVFQNFANAPSMGQDIGLLDWTGVGERTNPSNGSIILTGAGSNGLPNPYVQCGGSDSFTVPSEISSGNGFLMGLVFAYTPADTDQVLFDAGYTGTTGVRIWIPASTNTLSFAWGSNVCSVGIPANTAIAATFLRANTSIQIMTVNLAQSGNTVTTQSCFDDAGTVTNLTLLNSNDATLPAVAVALYGFSMSVYEYFNQLSALQDLAPAPQSAWGAACALLNFWINYYAAGQSTPYQGGLAPAPSILP